jgi:hypothetical protein
MKAICVKRIRKGGFAVLRYNKDRPLTVVL